MEIYIKDYLLKYSQVQIANFGTFKVEYKSSYIHPILHTFSVPGKYVIFTENAKTEDEDFAFFVSKKEKVTLDEAKNRIETWVQEIWKTIKEEKRYFDVSTLGSFFIDAMGRIQFEASLDTDISPDSFGLEEFKVQLPISSVEKEPVTTTRHSVLDAKSSSNKEIAAQNDEEEQEKPKKKKRRIGLWIFLILMVVYGAFVGVIYFAFPNTFVEYKTQALGLCNIKSVSEQGTENEVDVIEETETIIESEELPIEQILEEPVQEVFTESATPTVSAQFYYVIIGSFKESANADKFIMQKQSNYNNTINLGMGNSGYYLVGIGPYTEQDAESKQKEIVNAWILKK